MGQGRDRMAIAGVGVAREPWQPSAPRVTLVERAQAGDREAFEEILDLWVGPSLRIAYAIIGDEADARDATQDAFLRAWRQLPRLRDADRFDAWFSRILVNRCRTIRANRRRSSVREIHLSALPEPVSAEDPDVAGRPEEWISLDAVEHAFRRLSDDDRAVLVLHHLQHRPVADIAGALGIPVGTAKSRLFAARKALERALEVELR